MTEWTLLRPWFLLLFFLPLLLLALKWRNQRKGQSLISSRLLGYLGVDPLLKPQDFSYLKLSLKLIVWALAIIAMAGPAHRQQSDLYEQDASSFQVSEKHFYHGIPHHHGTEYLQDRIPHSRHGG